MYTINAEELIKRVADSLPCANLFPKRVFRRGAEFIMFTR